MRELPACHFCKEALRESRRCDYCNERVCNDCMTWCMRVWKRGQCALSNGWPKEHTFVCKPCWNNVRSVKFRTGQLKKARVT